ASERTAGRQHLQDPPEEGRDVNHQRERSRQERARSGRVPQEQGRHARPRRRRRAVRVSRFHAPSWRHHRGPRIETAAIQWRTGSASLLDYIHVTYGEPHAARGRQMLSAHPELRALIGPTSSTAVWTVVLVAAQVGLAFAVGDRPWWIWAPCAYILGATMDHALWALIHDMTHNLAFRSRSANRITMIVANLPLVVPGAISFAKYHLLHHRHMGDLELDAGVPGPTEARVVGRSGSLKAV